MSQRRIFITGSTDGLGLLAAKRLTEQGHVVALHARSDGRADDARAAVPEAIGVAVGDLSTMVGTRAVASQANALGPFDAVIHNAGIYTRPSRGETEDGLAEVFAVNVMAPYLLTSLISPPDRLVYLSSGLHRSGTPDLHDLQWESRPWSAMQAYSDSKLLVVALAFAVARLWPEVRSNAVDPGWVPTKMGGAGAPDDLELGAATQRWLATSDEDETAVSARYFHHQRTESPHPAAESVELQEGLLAYCAERSGVPLR